MFYFCKILKYILAQKTMHIFIHLVSSKTMHIFIRLVSSKNDARFSASATLFEPFKQETITFYLLSEFKNDAHFYPLSEFKKRCTF